MSITLGEKIRNLRKKLNITQSELAGSEMTKSMLSQIENNRAMPSMKSLQYLANQFNKPLSYFIEGDNCSAKREYDIFEKIRDDMKHINELINNNLCEEAKEKLQNILGNNCFESTDKTYADLLFMLGDCLMRLNMYEQGKEKLIIALDIYLGNLLFVEAAKVQFRFFWKAYNSFDYQECMSIIANTWIIYNKSFTKDYFFEIRVLYFESAIYSGLENIPKAIETLEKAITTSLENNIYYDIDELYSLKSEMHLLQKEYAEFEESSYQSRKYAEFTDNKYVLLKVELIAATYKNSIKKYEEAIGHLKKYMDYVDIIKSTNFPSLAKKHIVDRPDTTDDYIHYYFIESARANYYLGNFEAAFDFIKKCPYPEDIYYKYDFLYLWNGKTYEGLILCKLGRCHEAVRCIENGISKLEQWSNSDELAFAYKSLSEVYSEMKDYEKAYNCLKKSDEIKAYIKEI